MKKLKNLQNQLKGAPAGELSTWHLECEIQGIKDNAKVDFSKVERVLSYANFTKTQISIYLEVISFLWESQGFLNVGLSRSIKGILAKLENLEVVDLVGNYYILNIEYLKGKNEKNKVFSIISGL